MTGGGHLLLSEVSLANNVREFIEIYNPLPHAVDLSDYYISDDMDYSLLPGVFSNGPVPSLSSYDWILKFPDGASIAGGGIAVIAFQYDSFQDKFSHVPEFGIEETSASGVVMVDPGTMPGAMAGVSLVGSSPQLTNGGEGVVLFRWDGQSDLVQDVDIFSAGENPSSSNVVGNKTGVAVDGPDSGSLTTGYQPDAYTFIEVSGDAPSGESHKRVLLEDGYESHGVGGNGITGDDETTEDFSSTWDSAPFTDPTPGEVPAALIITSQCGDGVVSTEAGEECDDAGNSVTCDADCTFVACGDGFTNPAAGEQCDDSGESATCNANCTTAVCGDGHVNAAAGESCDDSGESATCDSDCTVVSCGDGTANTTAGEVCDDAGNSASCDADCTASECGDGFANSAAGEDCDDSGESVACDVDCTAALCGDSLINTSAGELCDDGGESVTCDADCTPVVCGDGVHNASAGEQCDDGGESASCDADCTAVLCGDLVVNATAGEVCDTGGNSATCDADCTAPECGDGVHNPAAGEACDDGGPSPSCTATCQMTECGDGIVNAAAGEECDDGGESVTCDADCTFAVCGDGDINVSAGEQCDDGDADNQDACLNTCVNASCGDGVVHTGVEECDDGNGDNSDFCTTTCESADCADGIQNADESDVDCGGHCGPGSCNSGQSCTNTSDCATGDCVAGICQAEGGLLANGLYHTCVALDTGAMHCWGRNDHGQLGQANIFHLGDNELPSTAGAISLGGNVVQSDAGYFHTCALLDTGAIRCFGNNSFGQLGYGMTSNVGDNEFPSSVGDVGLGGAATQVVSGAYHTCALLTTGDVRCWGNNWYGQLGYGDMVPVGDDELPSDAGDVDVGGVVVQITAGAYHTCALLDTGEVRCWGLNAYGQLGYGDTFNVGDNETPAAAGNVSVGGTVVAIDAGIDHTCALLNIGEVRCWGRNTSGQLGYGHVNHIGDNETPSSAGDVDVGGTVAQLAIGGYHSCAVMNTGALRCWGRNAFGQLGHGTTIDIGDNELPSAAPDVNVGDSVAMASAHYALTCALLDTGGIRCWGGNWYGQLGYGNTVAIGDDESPASAGDVPFL